MSLRGGCEESDVAIQKIYIFAQSVLQFICAESPRRYAARNDDTYIYNMEREFMIQNLIPGIWLIILIVGLPQISETVYTPSLPDIAHALHVSDAMVEYTLTVYVIGLACGTLFWGKVSDRFGRKPCVLIGLTVFIIGCILCYSAHSIASLMIGRAIQAFGGSVGSVLGQAICRDAFHGPALGKVYSSTATAKAFAQGFGPVIGGVIAENFGWSNIFLFLMFITTVLCISVALYLPETHDVHNRQHVSIIEVMRNLLRDKKAISFGIIVGGAGGITFSYFGEGSFYLIELLGMSPSHYGLSFVLIAIGAMLGGIVSKNLNQYQTSKAIMGYGLMIIVAGSAILSCVILLSSYVAIAQNLLIYATIFSQTIIMFGISMTTSNALALALVDYKWCIGTASSLFGFFYYCIASLVTIGMSYLHNGTVVPMPLYFLSLGLFMIIISKVMIRD